MLQRGAKAFTEVKIITISFAFSAVAIQRRLKVKRKIVKRELSYETKEYFKYMLKKITISFAFSAVANGKGKSRWRATRKNANS